jgi:hypothetical protein
MPTHAPERRKTARASLVLAAKGVAEHASALARLEIRLALLELKRKFAALGLGVGLAIGAAIFVLFALGFGFATIASALATTLPTWLSLLIVTAGLLLLATVLGLLALRSLKKGVPPIPEQALEEAKRTTEAVKGNGSQRNS